MINKQNFEYKSISDTNKDSLYDFYLKAFPLRNKIIFNNWKWIYRTNLFGYEPITVNYQNKVIGHAGMISTKIKSDKKIFKGIWFVDFLILPEFRGMGIGKKLTEKWMKVCPHQLSFCNVDSLKIFKKYGWVENYDYYRSCNVLNPLKWIPIFKNFNNTIINKINLFKFLKKIDFNNSIKPQKIKLKNNFFENNFNKFKVNEDNKLFIFRDDEWFQWRILASPFIDEYYFFEAEKSFIIVHIFKYKNQKRLNIIFSKCQNIDAEILLSKNIINWSINNDIDIVWLNSNDTKNKIILKKLFPYVSKINFVCNSDGNLLNKNDLKKIQGIQAIDGDNDILFSNNY